MRVIQGAVNGRRIGIRIENAVGRSIYAVADNYEMTPAFVVSDRPQCGICNAICILCCGRQKMYEAIVSLGYML